MKFKSIFFLFNIVVIFSFSLIFVLPLILLSGSYSSVFWMDNWYLAGIFFILIAGLDSYFIINWKLFVFLEKEDWNNLTLYLEDKIYVQGQFRKQYIKLMINTSLAVSNLDKIDRLAKEIGDRKPKLMSRYALLLGIPLFLRNNTEEAVIFYGKYKDETDTRHKSWVKWVYAFSLIQESNKDMAQAVLLKIFESKTDDILEILTLYSLDSLSYTSESMNRTLEQYREKYGSEKKWNTFLDSMRGKNIFILLLTGLLDEARKWAMSSSRNEISLESL
ncbi:MAG: hypothetical protein JEY91_14650 [Spirochaetaceae bacterium]|nr:hypothetical protein [Spirochaetaceae bacterium]